MAYLRFSIGAVTLGVYEMLTPRAITGSGANICRCSSIGRASDFHSEGRGFEPRHLLQA